MDRIVNKTIGAVARFGERIERRLSTDNSENTYVRSSSSTQLYPSTNSAFQRPFKNDRENNGAYPSLARSSSVDYAANYSADHLAASPGYENYDNYQRGSASNLNMNGLDGAPFPNRSRNRSRNYYTTTTEYDPMYSGNTRYGRNSPYTTTFDNYNGNASYAPNYYIAERREVELVPAPQPRIIREPVPVPVDRPVPQPYPVAVPTPYPVDRPVPIPVPTPVPVPVDRPVPVPVASPPVAVPCYVPVAVPVASPRASPVVFEQSVTHTQRWTAGSPVMMNQPQYSSSSSVVYSQPQYSSSSSVVYSQPQYSSSAAIVYGQPQYSSSAAVVYSQPQYYSSAAVAYSQPQYASVVATGLNGYSSYGSSVIIR